ncbi:MAG: hypothetical protein K2W96_07115, partial [Gemmataceae bacterium]|nr:hypothetical protein [Gemmataceae bacterium]
MAWTVRRKEGASLSRFLNVATMAFQRGADPAKARRVLDPATNLYWPPVFSRRKEAEALLAERWDERGWEAEETTGTVSEGPLGPIVFDVVFRIDEVMLSLDHRTE